MWTVTIVTISVLITCFVRGQQINRAPQFLPNGDMSRFAVPEDTQVGTAVYKLLGSDPEGSKLSFSISGEYFTVDKDSGIVTTLKKFDRENLDMIRLVISVTDEGIGGSEPNTISLQRQITILDINDNPPQFLNRPYSFQVYENVEVGKSLYGNITVEDKDGGVNGDVILTCINLDDTCSTFTILTEKVTDGLYRGEIKLHKSLDYERRTSYSLSIRATDRAKNPSQRLTSTANVIIDILDVQDQPPVFINSPYSATVPENTEPGVSILQIQTRDGDVGDPRRVRLELIDDDLGYFELVPVQSDNNFTIIYDLVTTDVPLDREHPYILENGGIYPIGARAVELINNELPAETSEAVITIVVTDIDDQLPVINSNNFNIYVTEDITVDSPLPGLNMVITDKDIGDNARYFLSLRDVKNSRGLFNVVPRTGTGHTPVVIRVNDTSELDYDVDDEELREILFEVVVSTKNEYGVVREVTSSLVTVHLQDTNDNSPIFTNNSYYLRIPENTPPNTLIYDIRASDKDEGINSDISYYLRGFGVKQFKTNIKHGGIYTTTIPLDYETQKSYTLNLIAQDGGNKTTSTNIYLQVEDVNDNKPQFDQKEYLRIIREKATSFQPRFFVHAVDEDGIEQGNGQIRYSIEQKNYEDDIFAVVKETGEIIIKKPVSSEDTPKGQYELIIRATDYGNPPLHENTRVNVRVGIPGNQRPIFKANAKSQNGFPIYKFKAKEDTKPNEEIGKVEAIDPDGADTKLNYYILKGGKDNFVINSTTGLLKTSPFSNLDLDVNDDNYDLQVISVDTGYPVSETGTITVNIQIQDVNNKPPYFKNNVLTKYINENMSVNSTIVQIVALDNDTNSDIVYSIIDPIKLYDKSGLLIVKPVENMFLLNNRTGDLVLNSTINHQLISVIILTVEAEDINADGPKQKSTIEVTIYTQSYNERNPIFLHTNWTSLNSVINIETEEEQAPNTVVFTLRAKDPESNETWIKFDLIENSHSDVFTVLQNGNIVVLKKLDYENLTSHMFALKVRATLIEDTAHKLNSGISAKETILDLQNLPQLRYTNTFVNIKILNINDNPPVFDEKVYSKRVLENIKYPNVIMKVRASDADDEFRNSTSHIKYSLSGENSNNFEINATNGEITVARNSTLDREQQNIYHLNVIATDTPLSNKNKVHKTQANVVIEMLDINDNPPKFSKLFYSAVIPENVNVNTNIIQITASDLDLGLAGEIRYEIFEENEAQGFFKIDSENGKIFTNRILTGKGRSEPYNIIIKASDKGDLVLDSNGKKTQKSLSSEVTLSIYIGDVVKNDGVPVFIRPTVDQVAYVSENVSVNTPIFQVIATDPDDVNSPEGDIRYKFLEDGKFSDELPFRINFETGLITTKTVLDREKKSSFDVIIVAHDRGQVPQQTTRVLHVEVTDVDDHKPYFKRKIDELPLRMSVAEEVPIGTVIGYVQAFDEDLGENALIDYIISYGNEESIFQINRTEDNLGVLTVAKRIDREYQDSYLLSIKCYKYEGHGRKLNYIRPYNRQDPTEIQVALQVDDIDDNIPAFPKNQITIGIRLNVPPDTSMVTLEAVDVDYNSPPIEYHITNVTFQQLTTNREKKVENEKLFHLDSKTGELRTLDSFLKYSDGFFEISVTGNNTKEEKNRAYVTVKVFVLRDRGLLKFVFSKPPAEVKKMLPKIEKAVADALMLPVTVNIYDTQYHSKDDGSLSFSSASSCFQIVGKEAYDLKDLETLLNDHDNTDLIRVYSKYNIQAVERCSAVSSKTETSFVQVSVLVIACLIGVLAVIAACTLCCFYSRYKREMRMKMMKTATPSTADYMTIRTLKASGASHHGGSQLLLPRAGSLIDSQLTGSQLFIPKSSRSVLGSQIVVPKGGSQLFINQTSGQTGSQLIINQPNGKINYPPSYNVGGVQGTLTGNNRKKNCQLNNPVFMGSSQMIVQNNTTILRDESCYEEQDKVISSEDLTELSGQVMYEYVGDGHGNLAYEDSS